MNTQPLEMVTNVQQTETTIQTDTDILLENGFSHDEIISLLWLQQWYQHGGSDRMEVVRNLEFVRHLIDHGKIAF